MCINMTCNPNCPYFRSGEKNIQYKKDEFGVKVSKMKFECEFDGKQIKSWDKECPRDKKES